MSKVGQLQFLDLLILIKVKLYKFCILLYFCATFTIISSSCYEFDQSFSKWRITHKPNDGQISGPKYCDGSWQPGMLVWANVSKCVFHSIIPYLNLYFTACEIGFATLDWNRIEVLTNVSTAKDCQGFCQRNEASKEVSCYDVFTI